MRPRHQRSPASQSDFRSHLRMKHRMAAVLLEKRIHHPRESKMVPGEYLLEAWFYFSILILLITECKSHDPPPEENDGRRVSNQGKKVCTDTRGKDASGASGSSSCNKGNNASDKEGARREASPDIKPPQKLNTRCAPKEVMEILAQLNAPQRAYLVQKGFGAILQMRVEGLETRGLIGWVMDHIDPNTMIFNAGPGKTAEFTKDVVHQIFGLPNSGPFPRYASWADGVQQAAQFKEDANLGKLGYNVRRIRQIIMQGGTDQITMRCIFLVIFERLLFPKGGWDINNEHVVWALDVDQFHTFDWCQLVYNDLCASVRKWHARDKDQQTSTVYGCILAILIWYLDHLYHSSGPEEKLATPRIMFWTSKHIQALLKADGVKGKWGNCDWRSPTDTCYIQGPAIYVPRLLPLLNHKLGQCSPIIADRVHRWVSQADSEIGKAAASMERARCQIINKQINLCQKFHRLVDFILDAEGGDYVRPELFNAILSSEEDNAPPRSEPEVSSGDQGQQEGESSGAIPQETPTEDSDGNNTGISSSPSLSDEFKNLDSLSSQPSHVTRRGREDASSSQQFDTDLQEDGDYAEKPTEVFQEVIPPRAEELQKAGEDKIDHSSALPRVSGPQSSPIGDMSNDTQGTPSRFLNLNDSQGINNTASDSTALAGDKSLQAEMDNVCNIVYNAVGLEDGNATCGEHDKDVQTSLQPTQEEPTQGPHWDLTPGTQRDDDAVRIDLTRQTLGEKASNMQPDVEPDAMKPEEVKLQSPGTKSPRYDPTPEQGSKRGIQHGPNVLDSGNMPAFNACQYVTTSSKQNASAESKKSPTHRDLLEYICADDSPVAHKTIMRFNSVSKTGLDVAKSFADKTMMEGDIMDYFVQCIRFDHENMGDVLPAHTLILDTTTTLFVPVLDEGHWILFVMNHTTRQVDILDSNPYKDLGTDWQVRHFKTVMMSGKNQQWAKALMKRLSKCIHLARPKCGIPKFGNWPIKLLPNVPPMVLGTNDCGFYVIKYIQHYDPYKSVVKQTIHQELRGDIRAEVLNYLMWHHFNIADEITEELRAFQT